MKKLLFSILVYLGMALASPKANACQCLNPPRTIGQAIYQAAYNDATLNNFYILKIKITDIYPVEIGTSGVYEPGYTMQILEQYTGSTNVADTISLQNWFGGDCFGVIDQANIDDTFIVSGGMLGLDSFDRSPCNYYRQVINDTFCDYYVSITDTDTAFLSSCIPTANIIDSIDSVANQLLPINEANGIKNYFTIYPNPTNNNTNLIFSLNEASRVSASIIDQVGKTVKTIFTSKQYGAGNYSQQIDLSNLSKGIYYLRITTQQQSQTIKFIIN